MVIWYKFNFHLIIYYVGLVDKVNSGGDSYKPSCNEVSCDDPEYQRLVDDYFNDQETFLADLRDLLSQRPLTQKHREVVSNLITLLNEKLLLKFSNINFKTNNCTGKTCLENVDKIKNELKSWDCTLADMLSEAIDNKD